MKVLILAAGEGKRLSPLTKDRPKCMVPFLDKPLIEYQLEVLKRCGLTDISFVTGYRAEKLKPYATHVFHNEEFDKTNMMESLMRGESLFNGQDDVLIGYSDILYEEKVIQTTLSAQGDVVVPVNTNWKGLWQARMENPLSDAESLVMDDLNNLVEIGKKVQSEEKVQAQYMGLVKVSRSFAKEFCSLYHKMDREALYDGQPFKKMYLTSYLQYLITLKKEVKAAPVDGGWLEIDSLADLDCYTELSTKNRLAQFFQLPKDPTSV